MLATWNDSYSIHNERIDEQHKKLFDMANYAYSLNHKHISKQEITDILADFFNYMKVHFKDEEHYMESLGYPGLEEHKVIHKHIIQSLVKLVQETKNLNEMKENLSIVAKKWLLEHILHEDMKIANWRKQQALSGNKIVEQKREQKFYYVCGCDEKVHSVSKETHHKIQSGSKFRCKKCGQAITFQQH